jgi:hypothetical protein
LGEHRFSSTSSPSFSVTEGSNLTTSAHTFPLTGASPSLSSTSLFLSCAPPWHTRTPQAGARQLQRTRTGTALGRLHRVAVRAVFLPSVSSVLPSRVHLFVVFRSD